jgi:replicative DNA helicase
MSTDFERALLGAVLQGYRDVPALSRIVSGPDFDSPQHEWIWNACLRVDADGEQVSALRVYDALGPQAAKLPSGHTYLTDLFVGSVPTSAPFYAEKVREASVRRQIARLGVRCQQMVSETDDMDPADMIARIQQWAGEVRAGK